VLSLAIVVPQLEPTPSSAIRYDVACGSLRIFSTVNLHVGNPGMQALRVSFQLLSIRRNGFVPIDENDPRRMGRSPNVESRTSESRDRQDVPTNPSFTLMRGTGFS
jgi:hypothetical protein